MSREKTPPGEPEPPASASLSSSVRSPRVVPFLSKAQWLPKEAVTPQVQSLMGTLYLEVGKPQEAMAVLKPLADAEAAEAAVLYNAGRAALLLNQVPEARTYLTRSVFKQPASPAARGR